jgi:CRP-like cAMP-binding protein
MSKPEAATSLQTVLAFQPLLARIPILRDLSQAQLDALAGHLRLQEVPKGTTILQEGETGDETFFLAAGELEINERMTLKTSRTTFEDKERTLVRLSADQGIFFGELALFDNVQRSATVVALTDCILLVLTREAFDAFAATAPDAAFTIFRAVGKMLGTRILKLTGDVKKLTTALSIAMR